MARIIAVTGGKGGILKSSITTNLAGLLSKEGRVLIIDTDSQGNSSLSFGQNPDLYEHSLYDVLVEGLNAKRAIYEVYEGIDIIPSNDTMELFDIDVLTNIKKFRQPFYLLRDAMSGLEHYYDYILVDTPPNLGLMQGNILSYAHETIIPFQPEVYSMRSLQKMLRTIQLFKRDHNSVLNLLGVVAVLVDSRTTLHAEVLQECRRFCYENNVHMFDSVIPRTIRYASSVAYSGLPATLTETNKELIKAYIDLKGEITNV